MRPISSALASGVTVWYRNMVSSSGPNHCWPLLLLLAELAPTTGGSARASTLNDGWMGKIDLQIHTSTEAGWQLHTSSGRRCQTSVQPCPSRCGKMEVQIECVKNMCVCVWMSHLIYIRVKSMTSDSWLWTPLIQEDSKVHFYQTTETPTLDIFTLLQARVGANRRHPQQINVWEDVSYMMIPEAVTTL